MCLVQFSVRDSKFRRTRAVGPAGDIRHDARSPTGKYDQVRVDVGGNIARNHHYMHVHKCWVCPKLPRCTTGDLRRQMGSGECHRPTGRVRTEGGSSSNPICRGVARNCERQRARSKPFASRFLRACGRRKQWIEI